MRTSSAADESILRREELFGRLQSRREALRSCLLQCTTPCLPSDLVLPPAYSRKGDPGDGVDYDLSTIGSEKRG